MKFYREKQHILKITGTDKQDFLQRTSTNDFGGFGACDSIRTVFTNEKGRIVDFSLVASKDGIFYIFCTRGNETALTDFFNKYIVTEDIRVETQVRETLIFYNDNKDSKNFLFERGISEKVSEVDGNIFVTDSYGFEKTFVLMNNQESDFLRLLITENEEATEEKFGLFALRNRFIYSSRELNASVNPLECGLQEFISFSKGCYIGQEVISRLDTQNKVQKEIFGFSSSIRLEPGDKIFTAIENKEEECGYVSSVFSTDSGFEGTGFLKKIYTESGKEFYTKRNGIQKININKFSKL